MFYLVCYFIIIILCTITFIIIGIVLSLYCAMFDYYCMMLISGLSVLVCTRASVRALSHAHESARTHVRVHKNNVKMENIQ